jgi:hypothetical protein
LTPDLAPAATSSCKDMVPANAPVIAEPVSQPNAFGAARARLTDLLIQASLIESYHSFRAHGKPYPFPSPESLMPGVSTAALEHPFQRAALVCLVDGVSPVSLNKHIRVRRLNEANAGNLARLAPELDPALFRPAAVAVDDPGFEHLFTELLNLDYALIVQQAEPSRFALTHMHVKIERLTDNAIRELAKTLGYIERRLFERGEAFVEALEIKFYEYYGFSPNASGRKSAAAMAAQLLASRRLGFVIFAACQEDCRLTIIDDSDVVDQIVLAKISSDEIAARLAGASLEPYIVDRASGAGDGQTVVIHRARFRRTVAARPGSSGDGRRRPDANLGLIRAWLELVGEDVLPRPGGQGPAIPFPRLSLRR